MPLIGVRMCTETVTREHVVAHVGGKFPIQYVLNRPTARYGRLFVKHLGHVALFAIR
jgi:hypothetical protein